MPDPGNPLMPPSYFPNIIMTSGIIQTFYGVVIPKKKFMNIFAQRLEGDCHKSASSTLRTKFLEWMPSIMRLISSR